MTRLVGVVNNFGIHPHGVVGNGSTRFLVISTNSVKGAVLFRHSFHELASQQEQGTGLHSSRLIYSLEECS